MGKESRWPTFSAPAPNSSSVVKGRDLDRIEIVEEGDVEKGRQEGVKTGGRRKEYYVCHRFFSPSKEMARI